MVRPGCYASGASSNCRQMTAAGLWLGPAGAAGLSARPALPCRRETVVSHPRSSDLIFAAVKQRSQLCSTTRAACTAHSAAFAAFAG